MPTATGEEKQQASAPTGGFWSELFQSGSYKSNQGRITRRVTLAAVATIFAVGAWRLSQELPTFGWFESLSGSAGMSADMAGKLAAGLLMLVPGLWFAYRVVQMPRFADFLISVEAEMAKVTWPSKSELYRASLVVLVTVLILAMVLFVFDFAWSQLFGLLKIRGVVGGG